MLEVKPEINFAFKPLDLQGKSLSALGEHSTRFGCFTPATICCCSSGVTNTFDNEMALRNVLARLPTCSMIE